MIKLVVAFVFDAAQSVQNTLFLHKQFLYLEPKYTGFIVPTALVIATEIHTRTVFCLSFPATHVFPFN